MTDPNKPKQKTDADLRREQEQAAQLAAQEKLAFETALHAPKVLLSHVVRATQFQPNKKPSQNPEKDLQLLASQNGIQTVRSTELGGWCVPQAELQKLMALAEKHNFRKKVESTQVDPNKKKPSNRMV